MPLSPTDKLILVAIFAALMIFVVFFELRVMRTKSREIRAASQKKDEAFNSVLTTRSVLNAVRNRGGNVGGSPAFLERAKEAMNRGNYDSCIELCEKARSEITTPSSTPILPPDEEDVDARDRLEAVAKSIVSTRAGPAEADSYKGTKLQGPKEGNYLGAKFEMSAAKADIGKASSSGWDTSVADGLLVEAEAAYTSGDYDKALSLAVRARKAASGSAGSEAIPLREKAAEQPAPEAKVYDVKEETARAPEGKLCRDCGAVLEKGDLFCPICGSKVKSGKCPSCGVMTRADDKFCRKCGAKLT